MAARFLRMAPLQLSVNVRRRNGFLFMSPAIYCLQCTQLKQLICGACSCFHPTQQKLEANMHMTPSNVVCCKCKSPNAVNQRSNIQAELWIALHFNNKLGNLDGEQTRFGVSPINSPLAINGGKGCIVMCLHNANDNLQLFDKTTRRVAAARCHNSPSVVTDNFCFHVRDLSHAIDWRVEFQ